jgi:hypothetical protein
MTDALGSMADALVSMTDALVSLLYEEAHTNTSN